MNSEQAAQFEAELLVVMELHGKPPPSQAVKLAWWEVLSDFSFEAVQAAFKYNLANSKFVPKPADIVEIILTHDGRPTADEAWAFAQNGFDESLTVVWTDEASTAFLASALPLARDKVAARMAFRDHYTRLVQTARTNRVQVHWHVSRGHDPAQANEVINNAEVKGLLTHEQAQQHLQLEHATGDGKIIAQMLIGNNSSSVQPSEKNKENIAKLRAILSGENNG